MKSLFLIILHLSIYSYAQQSNQLNLDDVQIKGEASGSKLLNISARKKNSISDRIVIKSSLVPDILESLPEGFTTDEFILIKKKK
jgi:murein tripeptide amidase MpaA